MENIKELLTSEQMEMLMNDLSHQDIVALFFMNEEDKYHFFVEKFNEFSNRHCDYLSEFNKIHDKFLELESSHKPECFDCFDLLESCFKQMLCCYDYTKYMRHFLIMFNSIVWRALRLNFIFPF